MSNATLPPSLYVLVISPIHDVPTIQSYRASKQIFDLLHKVKNIEIKHMRGPLVNHSTIKAVLSQQHFDFIIYFGHGKTNGWYDPSRLNMLFNYELEKEFDGSIVYSMACYSATGFGQEVIDHGGVAYIGSTQAVWGAMNTPEQKFGEDFVRPFQNEVLNLLRGVPVERCVQYCRDNFNELAMAYEAHGGPIYLDNASKARWNADHHVYVGNGNASLVQVIDTTADLDMSAMNGRKNWFL